MPVLTRYRKVTNKNDPDDDAGMIHCVRVSSFVRRSDSFPGRELICPVFCRDLRELNHPVYHMDEVQSLIQCPVVLKALCRKYFLKRGALITH